jgi:type II secretion system protein G
MNMRKRTPGARGGFTLIEVLVTLVLIALLVGVIVPSVINQLGAGEPTRVAQDLEAVRSGVKLFRVDVRRFPHTPEQLVIAPAKRSIPGDGFALGRWRPGRGHHVHRPGRHGG